MLVLSRRCGEEVIVGGNIRVRVLDAYLALYHVACMLDDALMLGAVVGTPSRRRLQEREGRWLKLISGIVILALGTVMLLKPE